MGFWKGLAKSGVGTLNGIGSATIGLTKGATIASRNTVGKSLFNTVTSNPGKVGAAVAIGAAAGAIGGDLAKEDTSKTTMLGAGTALGVSVLGGGFLKSGLGAGAVGTVGAAAVGVAGHVVGAAGKLGASMIKMPDKKVGLGNLNEIKFKKGAIPLLAGAVAIGGLLKAEQKMTQSRMGTHDGMMRSATPIIPQVSSGGYDNGGATGDLVFAMRNNR